MNYSPLHTILSELSANSSELNSWHIADHFGNSAAEAATAQTHVVLADLSASTKIYLEGQAAGPVIQSALDVGAGDLAIGAGLDAGLFGVYRLRQDQFLVHGGPGMERELLEKLGQAANSVEELITATDRTHGKAEIGVIGPNAAALLARLCGLDFADGQFPNLTAKQSSVAKTSQLILRHDIAGIPAYALLGDRSFGVYLWQTAFEAGKDLGIGIAGAEALVNLAADG